VLALRSRPVMGYQLASAENLVELWTLLKKRYCGFSGAQQNQHHFA
jgi:hypothetical protein